MLKIFLVRHGETSHNKDRIIQGQLDTLLSSHGRAQAKALAKYFKDIKFDAVYSSDLKRAKSTCKAAISNQKIKVIYDSRLRERHWGTYQGRRGKEVRRAAKKSGKTFIEFKPRGGESILELYDRVKYFLNDIIKKHKKEHKNVNILVVSHGGVMTNMLLYVAKDSHDNFKKYHPPNAAITILTVKDNIKIHTLNYVKHLS